MNVRRSLSTVFLILIAVGLMAGFALSLNAIGTPVSLASGIDDDPAGSGCCCCQDILVIHDDPGEPNPITTDKEVVCAFHLHFLKLDKYHNVQWKIVDANNQVVKQGSFNSGNSTSRVVGPFSLPNGNYKVKWQQANCCGHSNAFTVSCPTPTHTFTPLPTATNTPVPTATSTYTPEPTATSTYTPDPTATNTPLPTVTETPLPTATNTPTGPTPTHTPWQDIVPSLTPTVTATPEFAELPTPTPPPENKSHLSVICEGCWDNQAVLWVGGTEQPALTFTWDTAHNEPAVLWTLWNKDPWSLRVMVTMPAGLDPNRWKFIRWVGTGPEDYVWTNEASFTINPGESVLHDFQLVDTAFWPK